MRAALLSGLDQAYLRANGRIFRRITMSAIVSTTALFRPLLLIALAGGVLFAMTIGLWAYYGTAVFFEMVRAGWVACF
jgi:hypothetical protein